MRDDSSSGISVAAGSSSSHRGKVRLAQLKRRLVKFWNSQEIDRNPQVDEAAANLPFRERMASFVQEGSHILDVACGTTANARWLISRGTYFGVDISLGLLRLVRERNLRLTCADAESLPFGNDAFDTVLLTFALEHSVNPVAVLEELCRVVRPQGRIILLGPSWDLPFWYPPALRSRAERPGWRLRYTLGRLNGQLRGWLLGQLPFMIIEEPDALNGPVEFDGDAVYITWTYEVIRKMNRLGCQLIYSEVDSRLLGSRRVPSLFKRLLLLLPPYQLAGSTVLMVFQR